MRLLAAFFFASCTGWNELWFAQQIAPTETKCIDGYQLGNHKELSFHLVFHEVKAFHFHLKKKEMHFRNQLTNFFDFSFDMVR